MIEIVITIGRRIVIDAAEAGQKEEGSAVVGGRILDCFAFFFRINRHGCEPLRDAFTQILLIESLALDSVWIAPQHKSSIEKNGQNVVGVAVAIVKMIPLGWDRIWVLYLVPHAYD